MTHKDFTARPDDGKDILRILESSPAKGSIELLYTRRPDAYESYMKEPGEARVFVSREDDRVVGTCAELIRDVYIGGKVCRAAYLCGLKKVADHKGHSGLGPTRDISPLRILNNWGSSSRCKLLKYLPIGVTRSSFFRVI